MRYVAHDERYVRSTFQKIHHELLSDTPLSQKDIGIHLLESG